MFFLYNYICSNSIPRLFTICPHLCVILYHKQCGFAAKRWFYMKGWFQRFMAGRYGFDQFGGFLCISSLILIVIGAWVSPVLYWLGLAAIVYSYFRILSRNTRKRYSENLKYLSYQNRVTTWFGKQQVRFKQRKDYHYYRCPQCGQQLRVPRGRGKISITCPKCGHQFIKKS